MLWQPLVAVVVQAAVVAAQHLEKFRSVWIEQGLVRGRIWNFDDKLVQMFLGIPFAEPPVDDLRFRKPVKKKQWHREHSALEYRPPCVQFMDFHHNDRFAGDNMKKQSEDCLYLNVFAPYDKDDDTRTHPVLVWIHGGSFLAGSADTGIDVEVASRNIVFRDVVLVTVNYRLGPLGFICTKGSDGKWKGNYGLWDQLEALKWIQLNIRQFGGDPNSVTMMGESAGAASVSTLALSPLAEGLMHRAIVLSGSATAGWAIHRHGAPEWDIANVVRYLRCEKQFDAHDLAELLKVSGPLDGLGASCNLLSEPPACLADLGDDASDDALLDCLRHQLNFTSFIFRKGLTVELGVSKLVADGELVPAAGERLVRNNTRIPILTGIAKEEWAHKKPLYYGFKKAETVGVETANEKLNAIMEASFSKSVDEALSNSTLLLVGNATLHRYLTSHKANKSWHVRELVKVLQTVEADIEFVAPCQREVSAYADMDLPVYLYTFDHLPSAGIVEEEKKSFDFFGLKKELTFSKRIRFEHAFHGVDHAYIFTEGYTSNFEIKSYTAEDKEMSEFLCTLLTNFAKKGNPTPTPTRDFQWAAYERATPQYAELSLQPRMVAGQLFWPAPSFWNEHVAYLTRFVDADEADGARATAPLSDEERLQLNAYRRAWWALWILVAAIAILLWTVIICLVARKCSSSPRSKPYGNIVVTNNR